VSDEAAQWQTRPEAGTSTGLKFLRWVAQHLGRSVLHALLAPVSLYFYLIRGPERRASSAYLSRVLGRPARPGEVLRHFRRFANVTADRFFFIAGRDDKIDVRFVIDPALEEVLATGTPGIFLAAHFGSFEAARVLGPQLGGIRLRIVLDKALNQRFMDIMAEVEPELANLIIDSEQNSVALGLNIGDALQAGDWVGFLADRHRTGDRTAKASFLGAQAHFPIGPYIIANVFKSPIIGAFCRLTDTGYEVHCEVLTRRADFPRKARQQAINDLLQTYVNRLEYHVRASPYAWFNFYDFWTAGEDENQ
jgi:predicted LPLAT superfamily acyltransferase